jgi:hypothetical protein
MKNCMQIQNRFDLSSLDAATPVFHRIYSKRQKYNRELDESYTLIPTSTYSLSDDVIFELIKQIPPSVLEIEVPQVFILQMEASDAQRPVLGAHVDFNRSCGINVYLEASGEITHYYHWNGETKTLEEEERFVAKTGDCWLMDTSVPHSVSLVPGKQRKMLTFSFVSATYDQIRTAYQ